MDTRKCNKCGEVKPVSEFYVKYKATGRRFAQCKECYRPFNTRAARAERAIQRALAPPKVKPTERVCTSCGILKPICEMRLRRTTCRSCDARKQKERNELHPEYQAAVQERYKHKYPQAGNEAQRRHYAAHRAEIREKARQANALNPEPNRLATKKWRSAHKDVVNAQTAKRRARKRNAEGNYIAAEWQAIKAKYNYTCLLCGKREPEIKLEADHVVPLSQGGSNNADNLQPLCRSCNGRKHIKTLDLRAQWQESEQNT